MVWVLGLLPSFKDLSIGIADLTNTQEETILTDKHKTLMAIYWQTLKVNPTLTMPSEDYNLFFQLGDFKYLGFVLRSFPGHGIS